MPNWRCLLKLEGDRGPEPGRIGGRRGTRGRRKEGGKQEKLKKKLQNFTVEVE